jgi:flagellar M-ring protein FliF
MADWAARFGPVRDRWAKLSLMARVGIAAAALMAVGALVFATTVQREPRKAVLFSNLSDDDAARIVDKLRAANIPYSFGPEGTSLLVPETTVHETRLMLASEGLPSGGGVGFEVFDQQRFGESEFAEQVKYHRALEGELARTISHLAGVKGARVHLVLPARSLFAGNEESASASIVVHLVPGWKMRDDQVKGIVHLVASSVRGLDPEHVTLVDGEGRTLGRGSHDENALASEADAYRREIEKGKERAAQQMLDTTLGNGKSMVRVAAAVSFTREEVTEETYDPQTIAQRSMQVTEERDGAGNRVVSGIPGTPSNLPGGEASNSGPGGGGAVTRRSETRNYEVSKVLRRAVEPVGRVTGMQVAVVVDGRYRGVGDKRKFEALGKDELDRIQHLVAGAIGIDEKRGDRIVVECIAFAPVTLPPDDRTFIQRELSPYSDYLLYGGIALLAFIAYRSLKKALLSQQREVQAPSLADVLGAPSLPVLGAAGGYAPPTAALPEPVHIPQGMLSDATGSEDAVEQVRLLASQMASSEPEAAARVIRGWLADNNSGGGAGGAT